MSVLSRDRQDTAREQQCWSLGKVDPAATLTSVRFRATPYLLVMVVVALSAFSLNMVYSATIAEHGSRLLVMQCIWMGVGVVAMFCGALFPLDKLYRNSLWGVVAVGIVLFYLTIAFAASRVDLLHLCPFAHESKGAVRWLRFAVGSFSIQIQPSEFAKPLLLIFLAAYYGRVPRARIKQFVPGVLIPGGVAALILGFIFLGKDLSTTVITASMAMGIMFLAGVRIRTLIIIITVACMLLAAAILQSPMRVRRMTAFREPEKNKLNESYQLYRSLLCLGGGGTTGSGYSQGVMKSYLPEAHTDFIVAVIGEEFGIVGVYGVIGAYLLLCTGIYCIAQNCRRREDLLLCLGIVILIFVQAFVNISVVSGFCPPTGVTAPFLSYGGSSIMSLAFMVGMVLNVHRRNAAAIQEELYNQRYTIA